MDRVWEKGKGYLVRKDKGTQREVQGFVLRKNEGKQKENKMVLSQWDK